MNNRGEKYLSVYWFAILAIVAGGIIAMVFVFYGKPYDVRNVEAEIMINKIADCLSDEEGKLREDISNENVLQECHLNFGEKNEFYFEVDGLTLKSVLPSTENKDLSEEGIKQGYFNLKANCGKAENVVCVERQVYYLKENGSGETIKILSGVRKENV